MLFYLSPTGRNPAQVSNKKPEFTFCPSYEEYFAILGETSITVTWEMPIATDEEDTSPRYLLSRTKTTDTW